MNQSQRSMLRSIVEKCSEDELDFLQEQFSQAHGVAKEESSNPFKEEDFEEIWFLIQNGR